MLYFLRRPTMKKTNALGRLVWSGTSRIIDDFEALLDTSTWAPVPQQLALRESHHDHCAQRPRRGRRRAESPRSCPRPRSPLTGSMLVARTGEPVDHFTLSVRSLTTARRAFAKPLRSCKAQQLLMDRLVFRATRPTSTTSVWSWQSHAVQT